MRPLRLQVENLACFRGRHEVLELSGFELFAIAGPTGAGKSSLLDAMVFALYGRVPRLGAHAAEMIALGRDRMAVTLDFRLGGRVYRVARTLSRNRKGKASEAALEEIVGGEERPIAEGPAAVTKMLERIVGLGYDAFTQAVMLPQGEFQRFLKCRPADRRAILADLLRLQVYKKMYDRAAGEASRLGAVLQAQQALIDGEAENATPEAIAAARQSLLESDAEGRRLRLGVERIERQLGTLRERRQQTLELEDVERRAHALASRESESKEAERRLLASERAAQLQSSLLAAAKAREDLRSWGQRWEKARRAESEAALVDDTARRDLQAAQKAAEEIPALDARLREIDAVSGLVAPLESARRRLAESQKRHERIDRELEGARAAERQCAQACRDALTQARAAARARDAAGYDGERHARLEAHRETALLLGQLRAAVGEASGDAMAATAEAERADFAERKATQALAAAEKTARKAAEALAAAEQAQRDAERSHAAMHLRAGLKKGAACPVCEQAVARPPKIAAVSALDAVAARTDAARREDQAARAAQQQGRDGLAEATAAHRQAKAQAERTRRDLASSSEALETSEAQLLKALGKDVDGRASNVVEERLRASLERLAAAKAAHEAAVAKSERAENEQRRSEQTLAAAKEKAISLAAVLEEQAQAAREAEREAAELQLQIDAVTRGAPPAAERARLEKERLRLGERREQAQRRERDAAEALLQARLEREQAQHAQTEAQRALGETGTQLERELRATGFASAAEAQQSLLDAQARAALRETLDVFRSEAHALKSRLRELRERLAEDRVDAEALAAAEAELACERDRLLGATALFARLSERIADLERRAARAKELGAGLQRERRRQAVSQQLATDLRSENFRAFVLEETFHELVAGASERLFALSGRYTFAFQDDAFQVLDHDNAGERRSADTLSGGETFLASLALALELSQQIQRAAGAVHLESLFIDEGFGSLDPETLDTIAAALEELPVGGRMVGVITHLPELTERIPNRVRVEKLPDGSRFSVEAA